MSTQPQAVTSRYITNLLLNGANELFELDTLEQRANIVDETRVQVTFKCRRV
jgi:hypothetical protein